MNLPKHSGNRPGLDESLTDAEYDSLAKIFRGFAGEDSTDLEEMDGFFAALLCGTILRWQFRDEVETMQTRGQWFASGRKGRAATD